MYKSRFLTERTEEISVPYRLPLQYLAVKYGYVLIEWTLASK